MKGMLIPVDGEPVEIDIKVDEEGSTLHDLQRLVGGNIEPFDVIFGAEVCVYVNEEGLYSCPPNRAVYATEEMADAGYLSTLDFRTPVKEGDLHSILFGDLVAVGFDPMSGEDRDLSAAKLEEVSDYFTNASAPGSGLREVIAIKTGQQREGDPRVTLKCEAEASRAASEKLADERSENEPQPSAYEKDLG